MTEITAADRLRSDVLDALRPHLTDVLAVDRTRYFTPRPFPQRSMWSSQP